MNDLKKFSKRSLQFAVAGGLIGLAMLTGCKSKEQQALDQAKSQAASTGQPQQVQYIDANGDTNTTIVQPPAAGQTQAVSTSITPPAPGPKPHRTGPVVSAYSSAPPPPPAPAAPSSVDALATTGAAPATDAPYVAPPAENYTPNAPAMNVQVPAGTSLAIRINQHISVKHNHAGDRFSGEVVEPISVNGSVVIPRGTPVGGRIDEAHKRGHFKGRSILELRLTSMELNGNRYPLDTRDNVRTKKGKGKRSTGFIAGMTGAGMVIGGIATGGVGLAIGGAAGAGAGTLIAGATSNRDIEIPAESVMRFRLADTLYVQNQ